LTDCELFCSWKGPPPRGDVGGWGGRGGAGGGAGGGGRAPPREHALSAVLGFCFVR